MDLNITRYTRETESDQRILFTSKPCGVEVKLRVKIVITYRHITESTQLFGTMENLPTEFSTEGQKPLNSNNQ